MSSFSVFRGSRVLMAGSKAYKTKRSMARSRKAAPDTMQSRHTGTLKGSPAFRKFLGIPEDSHEDIKKLSFFIKSKYRKEVHSDEQLKNVLYGKRKVGFSQIVSLMSRHFGKKGGAPGVGGGAPSV